MTGAPESRRQAQRWDCHKRQYLAVLGCHPCAAQAAWGRALGWTQVRPPCDECGRVVQTWPGALVNEWRTGEPVSAAQMTADVRPVSSDPAKLTRTPTTAEEAA